MYLPVSPKIGGNERRFESREPFTFDLLRNELSEGNNVIEIGACMGEFTIIISKQIGNGCCYSIEPFPGYIDIFRENIKANNLKNVIHIDKAIGNTNGFVEFSTTDPASYNGIQSLWDFKPLKRVTTERIGGHMVKVPIIKVSEIINNEDKRIDLLFMDIEGCETLVFDDLFQNVELSKLPNFYFESHQSLYGEPVVNEIKARFIRIGFSIEEISPQHFFLRKPTPQLI